MLALYYVKELLRLYLPRVFKCISPVFQSTWRKIQDLGLTEAYKTDEHVKQFTGKLDGLAFLPLNDLNNGLAHLHATAPAGEF